MAFAIKGRVEGLEEVLKALDAVDKKIRRKAIRQAVGAAGKIVLAAAKQKVPKNSGLLRKSLGRKVKVYRGSGVAVAIVGPRAGFRQQVSRDGRRPVLSDPAKYAHLVEGGVGAHGYKTRAGSHPGAAAHPFLRPALEDNKVAIYGAMAEILAGVLAEMGA